eukprot:5552531-Pleurochrysis_carterae.AAC.1
MASGRASQEFVCVAGAVRLAECGGVCLSVCLRCLNERILEVNAPAAAGSVQQRPDVPRRELKPENVGNGSPARIFTE